MPFDCFNKFTRRCQTIPKCQLKLFGLLSQCILFDTSFSTSLNMTDWSTCSSMTTTLKRNAAYNLVFLTFLCSPEDDDVLRPG